MEKEESIEKNIGYEKEKEKYGTDTISALAKEAVTYMGRKISSFRKIPSFFILMAMIPGIMVFIITLYTHLSGVFYYNIVFSIIYRALILLSGGLVASTILLFITMWRNHILWSKMAYLSLLDITDSMNNRDELMTRNIEEYIAYIDTLPILIIIIIYIVLIGFWTIVGEMPTLSLVLAIVNNIVLSIIAYVTYTSLKKESRYDHGILSVALKIFGGRKLRIFNPYINLKNMIIIIIATAGIAAYYWLYKTLELYNKHAEVYNEAETSLSVNLLKLI
ncbi:hypothetical protein J4526_00120 [Desulfurococcaceae archaeon MEX13E-LK6-19]|nr:hypothetical protein J4526_00120 [Desulfurococcaceae archaeon MEX13E-LK6-19]